MASELDPYIHWASALFEQPERLILFCLIAESPQTVGQLAAATGLSDAAVADHLGLLGSLGLVEAGGFDGAAASDYRLQEASLRRACEHLAVIPDDIRHWAGRPAPAFRLPAADSREIALANCLANGPAIVWFSRGLSCPICRRLRGQLTLGMPAFRSLGAQIVEITPTPVERAGIYFANYELGFPYLCDPSGSVAAQYGVKRGGLDLRSLRALLADVLGPKQLVYELLHGPQIAPSPEEAANYGPEEGFFIVDRSGVMRVANAGPYIGLPSNAEIERELRDLN